MSIKRKFIKTCSILMAAAVITGCGNTATDKDNAGSNKNQAETDTDNGETFEIKEAGIAVSIPKEYQEKGIEVADADEDMEGNTIIGIRWYYKPVTDKLFEDMSKVPKEDYTEEMQQDFINKMNIHSKFLMDIVLIEEKEYKEPKEGAEELGTNGGYMYLATVLENDTEGMDNEEKAQYEECLAYMETLKENIKFIEIEKNAGLGNKMPSFTTKDLKGNTVTDSIFSEKDLTVVNIWGTFCGPCIEEMPELAEWSKEMPDNVQIIGLVCDIEGEDDSTHKDLAVKIMEKAGADFTNIIPDSSFSGLLGWVTGVPTTIFVDKDGNITGEPVVGADVAAYKRFVEDYISGK